MPINNLPGVGPTNADIATAVAAPSAATIAAAVAAPSAATIASTVAASVPTLAQINTSVSSNASPYGGTWTTVSTTTFATVNTTTISSITGYKYLRIIFALSTVPANEQLGIRFNSDSGSNYLTGWHQGTGGINTRVDFTQFDIGQNPGYGAPIMLEVLNANSTSAEKVINLRNIVGAGMNSGWGHYSSNSAISSVTLFNAAGVGNFSGKCKIMGAN